MDESEFETHDIDAELAAVADAEDDAAEIRYSLTALGEAALGHDPRRGRLRPLRRGRLRRRDRHPPLTRETVSGILRWFRPTAVGRNLCASAL
jgi:hypothetical protein